MTAAHRLLEVKELTSEGPTFSTQTLFDLIYSGAIEKNIKQIQFATRYACINVVKGGVVSPTYQLALECTPKTNEALDFLIKINPIEHFTLLCHMARGYACGNHVARVEGVLAKATNAAEYFTLLQFVIWGYAQGGHEALAEDALGKATHAAERLELLIYMAFGYACGNHVALAEGLLVKAENNAIERLLLLKQIASGYAQNGNKEQAEHILTLANDSKEYLTLLKQVVFGYARSSHTALAKESALALTNKMDTAERRLAALQCMAWGYARVGNEEQIEDILTEIGDNAEHRRATLENIAFDFAQSGHVAKAIGVLAKAGNNAEYFSLLLNHLAFGYASNGHILQAESFLKAKNIFVKEMPQWIAYGYAQSGYETLAEAILAKAEGEERAMLEKKMVDGYIQRGYVVQAERVLMRTTDDKDHLALLQRIAISLKEKGLFLKKDSALFMLAMFNPKNQKELAIELEKITEEKKVDIMTLVPKAALLHPLLVEQSPLTRPINYRDRLGFNWTLAQEWLLITGLDLVKQKKLDNNLLFLISTFLAQISPKQAPDLFYKLLARYRPTLFHAIRMRHSIVKEAEEKNIRKIKRLDR